MSDPNVQPTGNSEATPAPAAASETFRTPKSAAGLARQRAGRISGGKRGRSVALIGLGEELPAIDLRDTDNQIKVLEATLRAVALGRTSGLCAASIVSIIKTAATIVATDQQAQIAELTRRVEELAEGRTVTVRRAG